MSTIKQMKWSYVGLVRTTSRLERVLRELRNLETEIEQINRSTRLTDGVIVAASASENEASTGCHDRE